MTVGCYEITVDKDATNAELKVWRAFPFNPSCCSIHDGFYVHAGFNGDGKISTFAVRVDNAPAVSSELLEIAGLVKAYEDGSNAKSPGNSAERLAIAIDWMFDGRLVERGGKLAEPKQLDTVIGLVLTRQKQARDAKAKAKSKAKK